MFSSKKFDELLNQLKSSDELLMLDSENDDDNDLNSKSMSNELALITPFGKEEVNNNNNDHDAGSPYFIPLEDIELEEEPIANGSYGQIYCALWKGKKVVAKAIDKKTKDGKSYFDNERRIMQQLKELEAPVVLYFGWTETVLKFIIVMEFMKERSVEELIQIEDKALSSWDLRYRILTEALNGLLALHNIGWIHRDVKCGNILVNMIDGKLCAKLGDFGLAKPQDLKGEITGTLLWMAPEIFFFNPHTDKSDMWSFGMTAWEISALTTPYSQVKSDEIVKTIILGKPEPIKEEWPTQMKKVITWCQQFNPTDRPSASQLLEFMETPLEEKEEVMERFESLKI